MSTDPLDKTTKAGNLRVDVLIVGAGPVGLTLAAALKRLAALPPSPSGRGQPARRPGPAVR